MDPGEALALARAAVPDGTLRLIGLPSRPDQPVRVAFLPPGGQVGQPTITAFIDQTARKVVEVRDPRQFTAGESFLAWQHALHAGEGLGVLWQGLVFVSGFLPVLFVITGLSMWWMKRRNRRAAGARRDAVLEAAE
jgi:uncharacterized iron-regulated membrane protein